MENAHKTDIQRLLDMVAFELREQEGNMETRTYEVNTKVGDIGRYSTVQQELSGRNCTIQQEVSWRYL